MDHDEPHFTRRKMILEKHPEIKELMTRDPSSFWYSVVLVAIQVAIGLALRNCSMLTIFLVTLIVGGLMGNALFVLIHDLTHFTAFKSRLANQLTAIFANFGHGIPTALGFQKFHFDHHVYQGRPNLDPDMPIQWEIKFFRTPLRKCLHVFSMILFYIIRPYTMEKKYQTPVIEVLSFFMVLSWDYFIYKNFGWVPVFYLVGSAIASLGPNPIAVRYFAEHFEFVRGQDTYSYYGPLNLLMFNVGYHIEHHDFPNIPWRNLPKVTQMAPEFYLTMPDHKSYFKLLKRYITDANFGAWCRIGRDKGNDINRQKID